MKPGQRGRGFSSFHKHVETSKIGKYIASCNSCRFHDEDEGCQNNNVTSFDIVKDGDRVYCAYWKGFGEEPKTKKRNREEW